MTNFIEEYCAQIRRIGATGLIAKPILVDQDGTYTMTYVPHEHFNTGARLVLVSTTPGHTHVRLAATVTEELLRARTSGRVIQRENKRRVELGGQLIRPNLIRMLDHFRAPDWWACRMPPRCGTKASTNSSRWLFCLSPPRAADWPSTARSKIFSPRPCCAPHSKPTSSARSARCGPTRSILRWAVPRGPDCNMR